MFRYTQILNAKKNTRCIPEETSFVLLDLLQSTKCIFPLERLAPFCNLKYKKKERAKVKQQVFKFWVNYESVLHTCQQCNHGINIFTI